LTCIKSFWKLFIINIIEKSEKINDQKKQENEGL
jgi:hypothetical protein